MGSGLHTCDPNTPIHRKMEDCAGAIKFSCHFAQNINFKKLNEFATMVQGRLDSCREGSRWRTAGAVPHPKGHYVLNCGCYEGTARWPANLSEAEFKQ